MSEKEQSKAPFVETLLEIFKKEEPQHRDQGPSLTPSDANIEFANYLMVNMPSKPAVELVRGYQKEKNKKPDVSVLFVRESEHLLKDKSIKPTWVFPFVITVKASTLELAEEIMTSVEQILIQPHNVYHTEIHPGYQSIHPTREYTNIPTLAKNIHPKQITIRGVAYKLE